MTEIVKASDVREAIAVGLGACGALLANGPAPDRMDAKYVKMWEWALEGLTPSEVATAFREHIKAERFFPTPADISKRVEESRRILGYRLDRELLEARRAELAAAAKDREDARRAEERAWKELPEEERARQIAEVRDEIRERWREKFGDDGPGKLLDAILEGGS